MSVFFDEIKKLSDVSDFTLRDIGDENIYKFNYKGLTLLAIQTFKQSNTLSRINLSVMCENLLNRKTEEKILKQINDFNKRTLTLKITLQKIEENTVFLKFSIEYSIDDELFKNINLDNNLILLFSASDVIMPKLFEEDKNDE